MQLTEKEKEAQQIILNEIEKAFSLLQDHLQKYCNEVHLAYYGQKTTQVPIDYIKQSIKIITSSMREGAEKSKS